LEEDKMPFTNTGSVGNGKLTKKIKFSVLKMAHGDNAYVKEIAPKIDKQISLKMGGPLEK